MRNDQRVRMKEREREKERESEWEKGGSVKGAE